MDQMSFNQFRKKMEPSDPVLCGPGWSAPRAVGQRELAVWTKVLELHDTGAELASKGAPTSVKSQMVSGYNYMFTFAGGSTVTVYHQSWTNTLQVTKTTPAVATLFRKM